MKNTLDELEKQAQEIEAQLEADEVSPDELRSGHVRKMRFESSGDTSLPILFVTKGQQREYSLEELALGRLVLEARGEVLPDAMESRFQSLAQKVRTYTMTTGGTGTGAELTDVILWDQLFQDAHQATRVAQLFLPYIDMASGKMELSELGDATFYRPSDEGQSVTATDLATAKRALTAYVLKAEVDVSDEEEEDAVVGALASIRATLVRNCAEVIDEVILNGDTTTGKENINYYYPTTGADIDTSSRFLIGFDGLIHYCLNEVTGQKTDLGALATEDFQTMEGLLDKYSISLNDCAYILDQWTYRKAKFLSDFTTVDKMGDKATLLTGQLGAVGNIPVVVSAQLAKSCSTGQVHQTAENNTVGRMLLVNRRLWKLGFRRGVRIATERDESKGLTKVVATFRIALQCLGDRSDAKYCHTALGYNISI